MGLFILMGTIAMVAAMLLSGRLLEALLSGGSLRSGDLVHLPPSLCPAVHLLTCPARPQIWQSATFKPMARPSGASGVRCPAPKLSFPV